MNKKLLILIVPFQEDVIVRIIQPTKNSSPRGAIFVLMDNSLKHNDASNKGNSKMKAFFRFLVNSIKQVAIAVRKKYLEDLFLILIETITKLFI